MVVLKQSKASGQTGGWYCIGMNCCHFILPESIQVSWMVTGIKDMCSGQLIQMNTPKHYSIYHVLYEETI